LVLTLLVILSLFFSYAQVRAGHYQAENLPRTTGSVKWNLNAVFGREVCGNPGQTGALIYGPYDWYDTGSYNVSYYLHVVAPSGTVVGRVEVSDAKTGAILASKDIVSDYTLKDNAVYQLAFSIKQSTMLEFRVWYYGIERLCIDQVIIQATAGK